MTEQLRSRHRVNALLLALKVGATIASVLVVSGHSVAEPHEMVAVPSNSANAATTVCFGAMATNDGSTVYRTLYRPGDWSGNVQAYEFDSSAGTLAANAAESANQALADNSWAQRSIITLAVSGPASSPIVGDGIAFRWHGNGLTDYQKTRLNSGLAEHNAGNGEAILQYLRGKPIDPAGSPVFRDRNPSALEQKTAPLGDIIHSAPIFIGAPAARYHKHGYDSFKSEHAGRTPMIYVGANDGMLHAFDANTLEELFAYVPATLIAELEQLTSPDYQHKYFVDGTPTVGDAYFAKPGESADWHTVLVGTTAAGGKSVFALDVTTPSTFDESHAADLVLWEINPHLDADYIDLGYSFSRPAIVRMANDQWAAVFGNGYDSTDGKAVLYIVDIATGEPMKVIELNQRLVFDPNSVPNPHNGLSTPTVVDLDGDHVADRIYVGDLMGNLWVIDVTAEDADAWNSAFFDTAGNPAPLFSATTPTGKPQPITVRPEVVFHPLGGQIVLFGTGSYFMLNGKWVDSGFNTQSFYGVRDSQRANQSIPITRDALVEQEIIGEPTAHGSRVRLTTSNAVSGNRNVSGWYLDFDTVSGERVISNPHVRFSQLIFTTSIPQNGPCFGTGSGWLMTVDPLTGSRPTSSPYDINGDNGFGVDDRIDTESPDKTDEIITIAVSGVQSENAGTPLHRIEIIDPDSATAYNIVSTPNGTTAITHGNPELHGIGRQSWHQLQ